MPASLCKLEHSAPAAAPAGALPHAHDTTAAQVDNLNFVRTVRNTVLQQWQRDYKLLVVLTDAASWQLELLPFNGNNCTTETIVCVFMCKTYTAWHPCRSLELSSRLSHLQAAHGSTPKRFNYCCFTVQVVLFHRIQQKTPNYDLVVLYRCGLTGSSCISLSCSCWPQARRSGQLGQIYIDST